MIKVLIWNEFRHERQQPAVAEIYIPVECMPQ